MDRHPKEKSVKAPAMSLAIFALVATTVPGLSQGTAGQADRALMPGSTVSQPALTGGEPPHEGHASTTCAKGPQADEKNALRPECPQMDSVIPRGVTANNGMTTGTAGGSPKNTQGR